MELFASDRDRVAFLLETDAALDLDFEALEAQAAISRTRSADAVRTAVEQDPLIVALDPAHVDFQHAGRLDRLQPRQKPLHATEPTGSTSWP